MGNISHALILSLLMVASCLTATAELYVSSHSLPYSAPTQAPAPSPTHHHQHHPNRPGGHHHHAHSPTSAPALAPTYHSSPPMPSKPVTSPPAKPPTYPTPTPPTPPTKAPVKPPTPPTKPPTPVKPPTQPPVKPPTKAPVKPPTYPPVKLPTKPPTQAPVKPPTYPPVKPPSAAPAPYKRKLVAVQGVVYCKNNCTYSGVDTLMGASPLSGATVVLRCRNTKYLLRKTATTDKNGYFFLQAPQLITTYGAHKCRVYLAKKPKSVGSCSHATNLNSGASGAFLVQSNSTAPPQHLPTFSLFTVGPFAYEPAKCYKH